MTNKSIKKIAASLVACLSIGVGVCSAGGFDYSDTANSVIQFNGDSTFTFTPPTNNTIIAGSALLAEITGTYTIGDITTVSGVSSAPVTGLGAFVIHDGAGFDLRTDLSWVEIDQFGGAGFLNAVGVANMFNITYSGSNPDLLALKNAGTAQNVFTFQFVPPVSLQTMKTGTPSTSYSGSVLYTNVPTCNCTLTFNGPSSLTNCAGDTIPAITATQDCGNGAVSVPVALVSATTNGTCPKIVTLTYGATDGCGNPKTFVQTVTVNCKGSVCGHIFADCDGSGDLTAGDVGLSNVVVTLVDASNKVLGTQKTDAMGGYCFTNLAGGVYTVQVTPPTGYSQTAASTSYHWKDTYGRICWGENDGYIHCLSQGTECWWDKSNNCHWKDSYGRDCYKDNWGNTRCQPCSYQTCNATTYNNKLTITLTNCTALTDVDFAYTGSKACVNVSVCAPSYVRCGQSCTYTCTVVNNGNVCFTGGKVCHTIGNCNNWGWGNSCTTVTDNCPPLSPGQSCTFTHKCTFNSYNCGTVGCQSSVTCYQKSGNNCTQSSSCYSQCGW